MSQRPACNPLVIRTSTWTVPGSDTALTSYLTTHLASGTTRNASGSVSNGSGAFFSTVVDVPSDDPVITDFLVFTFTQDGGHVDLRIDAEVPPADASCARS